MAKNSSRKPGSGSKRPTAAQSKAGAAKPAAVAHGVELASTAGNVTTPIDDNSGLKTIGTGLADQLLTGSDPIGTKPPGWEPGKPTLGKRSIAPADIPQGMQEPPQADDRVVQYTYISGVDPVSGWSVDALRQALTSLNTGSFNLAGSLQEDMSAHPLIAKCLQERFQTFEMLPTNVTPTMKRGDGRRCADFVREVMPEILNPAVFKTIHQYYDQMGFCAVGVDWEERTDGGQRYWLPQLKPWQPSLMSYIQMTDPTSVDGGNFAAVTMNKGQLKVQPGLGRWMLFQKSLIRPWMHGAVRVLGQDFVGDQENFHDAMSFQNRFGRGIMKLYYPRGYNVQELLMGAQSMANAGGGGVLPCMRNSDGTSLVDIEVLQSSAAGYQTFGLTDERTRRNILLYYLGQNMTSQGQAGGFAQAKVHDDVMWSYVRESLARAFGDAKKVTRYDEVRGKRVRVEQWQPCDGVFRTQLLNWIAYFNFGSFDLAPYLWWDAAMPDNVEEQANASAKRSQQAASSLASIATAVEKFSKIPGFNVGKMLPKMLTASGFDDMVDGEDMMDGSMLASPETDGKPEKVAKKPPVEDKLQQSTRSTEDVPSVHPDAVVSRAAEITADHVPFDVSDERPQSQQPHIQ